MNPDLKRASLLRKQGQYESARELLLQLIRTSPDDPALWLECAFTHDAMGLEKEAVPYYEKAIRLGLPEPLLAEAYLGLGSTYRCLGEYDKSLRTLEEGCRKFPDDRALQTFLAMTCYNLGEHARSMEIMLTQLAETTNDTNLSKYRRALLFYADKLDQIFR
ncbi:tetratricopeptide repeat protein [Lihuaxuella thermophila]|uniref:Tetratricopeptide repeat-containing protein n=1 Tax=Lihuaxuella thermophila TaxID=1173111 RepID=A0A1H8GUZ3_9BACL|nr:tetratricopeptide repeat protein [Lihuaxuella thermophila]SEN47941.1 Tetratricopeptide repeat-containing protein [Lihuaxuella thermophila]